MEKIPVWQVPGKALYVSRVAVSPDYRGLGFSKELAAFAESYAKSGKFSSIRMDIYKKSI